jgi:chromosome segregation and condensation protein ScpB
VFKDGSGLSTVEKLSLVGSIIGKSKIKKDDIYEAMLYIHEEGKITVKKLAEALKCTERTLYRNMCSELKEEKYLLNKQL